MHSIALRSVSEPPENVQSVVVARVAAEAVVVVPAAVELRVARVLHLKFDVEPRQIVDFGDPALGVRFAIRARGYSWRATRGVQPWIRAARGRKITGCAADLALVVVGAGEAKRG